MKPNVIILGGGFAGLRACRALRNSPAEVTLYDPRSETVMLPALPDLAAGRVPPNLLTRPLRDLLPATIRHVQAAVSQIDLDEQTILADGRSIPFDALLIAVGSTADLRSLPPGAGPAYPLDSFESALRIRKDFPLYLQTTRTPHLLIAGGGYTGLELAAALSQRARALHIPCQITLADAGKELLPFIPAARRQPLLNALGPLGITVQSGVRISEFTRDEVRIGDQRIRDVFCCWTAGSVLPVYDIRGSVERTRDGRLKVNRDLSLPGYPSVFVAGDAAAVEHRGTILRKAVNFACFEGTRAGKNIARRLRGKSTRVFHPLDAGWVIPLQIESTGRIFNRWWIGGRTGLRLHYFMCGLRNYSLDNFTGFVKIATGSFNQEE